MKDRNTGQHFKNIFLIWAIFYVNVTVWNLQNTKIKYVNLV